MNARRLWKIFRLNFKMMYSRWFLAFIAFYFAVYFMASVSAMRTEDYAPLFPYLGVLALLLASGGGSLRVVKSEVDFVFSTPVNPLVVYIAKTAASTVLPLLLLGAFTVYLPRPDVISHVEYAASLIFNTAFFALTAGASSLVSIRRWILYAVSQMAVAAVTIVKPELSPLYGLVYPSPFYVAYSGALAALMYAFFPRKRVRELAVNAYGVLAVAVPRVSEPEERAAARAQFGTPWRAVWVTSSTYYRRRGEMFIRASTLKTGLVISLVAAAAGYAAARLSPPDLAEVVLALQSFLAFFMFFGIAANTIERERLWLSLSGDADMYFRCRMLARSALTAVFVTPLAAEAAALALHFPPALHLIPGLASIPLVVPAASWLAAAYAGLPQMRELDLLQSPPRMSHRSYLAMLLVMAYYLFAFAPYYMAVAASYIGDLSHLLYAAARAWSAVLLSLSALFFYATTLSRWRRTVWSWFVNKLSENGYV